MRQPDDGLRALALTAVLVLVAVGGLLACVADQNRPVAAGEPIPWQEGIATQQAAAVATQQALAPATQQAVTPPPASTVAASTATVTAVASPSAAATTTVAAATPTAGTSSPTAGVSPTLGALASTQTPATTPTPPPTLTLTPTPSVTPTFTPEPSPTATPTPRPMALRDDLPAMALPDWPRPANDNGRGVHFLVDPYPTEEEIDRNIQRMLDMNMKWALVLYGDEIQLQKMAPRFRDAGIMVVWRKMLRPYEHYYEWERDIKILQSLGVPPYMQIYNEPSVAQEWPDGQSDQAVFTENLIAACEAVYNAGGYVGLQFVSENWLRDAIAEIKERGGERLFGRMFFIPHSYGMNHPPSYTEDINAVLNFRVYAAILQEQLGFVPPMIVGEGGWKWGATDDGRYPQVSDELHRDFYVELFNWFRTGMLSNGEPLPDYLFAFCPWLIAHKMDDNAFYDSFAGDRVITIEAIKAIPPFVRRFSWE
ncbi:MAG: hypothetical protein ACOYEW_06565 [Anaerolineae bacterium]|jgi:hypothetical protein